MSASVAPPAPGPTLLWLAGRLPQLGRGLRALQPHELAALSSAADRMGEAEAGVAAWKLSELVDSMVEVMGAQCLQ